MFYFPVSNSWVGSVLQVEQVIKEQNMLDVFVIIEGYCLLVIERVHLIEQEKYVVFPFNISCTYFLL